MAPPRILLCGDVFGRINQLFKRVTTVSKSTGPFDALFCVGQFFPDSSDHLNELMDYIENRSQIPIPTYFIGDYGVGAAMVLANASARSENRGFKIDGLKICENLYCLKGSGKVTLHGLCIAYLSGKRPSETQTFGAYSQDDIDALRAWAEEPEVVDLFLTNEWPRGVSNRADVSEAPPEVIDIVCTDPIISELVAEIKPRYHIAGTKGVYYAREPYSNVDSVHVTRFFGLASVGNKDKQKFIHAISPTPASNMSSTEICMKPPNTTLMPYTIQEGATHEKAGAKKPNSSDSDTQYWRYDVSQKRPRQGNGNTEKPCFKFLSSGSCLQGEQCNFKHDLEGREQFMRGVCFDFLAKGKCEKGADCTFKHSLADESESFSHGRQRSEKTNRTRECWFCLSSPKVESHLIVCIGEFFYCTLAKGPLVEDHALIIPIDHSPNVHEVEPEVEKELERFKKSLKMYFRNQGKEVLFYEWVSKLNSHANIQAVPIPLTKTSIVRAFYTLAAEKLKFKFQEINSTDGSSSGGKRYLQTQFKEEKSIFYVELPDGTILAHSVDHNANFSAQFGRQVLAGFLNVPVKADWKTCKFSTEDEMKMTEAFKKRFEDFDPTR